MRNWPATLRRASYRGVAFHVDKDTIDGEGRRLVVHEFPKGEAPYVEDNGRDATKIKITAYLVSDNVDSQEKALRKACAAGGAASLVLPMERLTAHCDGCKRDAGKDKLGYIAFDLSFVKEGASQSPLSFLALGAFVSSAASALSGALATAFYGLFRGLSVASFVSESAAATVRDIAASIDAVRAQTPLAPGAAAIVSRLTQDLYDNAETLAATGARGDVWTSTAFLASAADVPTQPLVEAVFAAVVALREGATPEDGRAAMIQLVTFGNGFEPISPITVSRRIEALNREALVTVLRVAALAQMVETLVMTDFTDRRQAIQARADVAELIDAELERLSALGDQTQGLWDGLADLQGRAAEMLSREIADLAPVLVVTAPREMPDLWWANRLYGDAARAGEIVGRNRVRHPLFMPAELEVLGR